MKQIAINLYAGVSCTLHANPGVQCAHNLVDCPPPDSDKPQLCLSVYHGTLPQNRGAQHLRGLSRGRSNTNRMKDYTKPYTTPYYDELKSGGVSFPCCLTHIRTDKARIEKPTTAQMFRMMFLTPRVDGCVGTLDTNPRTNLLMLWQDVPIK